MAKFLDLEGLNYFWEKIKSWIQERFAYKSDLNQKQDKLRSGQNIKTINNQDILGPGNIEIQGSSSAVDSVNGKTGEVVLNAEDVGALPNSTTIPTKVSDLTNDSSFSSVSIDRKVSTGTNIADITIDGTTTQLYAPTSGGGGGEENVIESISVNGTAQTVTNKNVDIAVPTKTSDLNNDSGFITGFTETDPTVPSWAKQSTKPSYNYSEIGNTPDLSGYATTQDLENAIDETKMFWAEVEVTTFAEIKTAVDAGKNVLLKDENGYIYILSYIDDGYAVFSCVSAEENFIKSYTVYDDDSYEYYGNFNFESQNNRVNSISSSSDTDHYPSARAVYQALQSYTPTSQLATVATSGDYDDLTNKPTIPTVPVQDVTVGGTSVVNNNGTAVIPQEVFFATYGTTTAAEIDAAVAAGKAVFCIRLVSNNQTTHIYRLVVSDTNYYWFAFVQTSVISWMYLKKADSTWVTGTVNVESSSNRVSTIVGYETNTTKYPNTKAVADALGKWGVISQTQTWSGTGTQPRTYVMSDLMYGTIPQANIDLFESAGATFNVTTGYFELNGLTDISYEEMQRIYNCSIVASTQANTRSMAFATPSSYFRIRCTLYLRTMTSFTTNFTYMCYGANNIEQVNIEDSYLSATSALTSAFQNAYCLKKIGNGYMYYIGGANDNAFKNCYSLETVYLKGLKANMKFSESPNLSMESIAYMVANAGTDNITITLHPTAYNAAIVNTDVTAALQTKTNVSLASA